MRFLLKTLRALLLLGVLAFAVYFFRFPLENLVARLKQAYLPCQAPIAYSIGTFDTRFGISRESFLTSVNSAENIWEKPVGKKLFKYSQGGGLKINLIYDDRQASTAKLNDLGITVNDDQATYNKVKAKYESLVADKKNKLAILDERVSSFQANNDAYNNEVESWNKRGGAPPDVYAHLLDEKAALNATIVEIKALQANFNKEVEDINASVDVLNRLAETLHIEAAKYNSVGSARAGEFTEGEYTSGPDGTAINIYQFDDKQKLVRVLAHEFGHALGLEHVEDVKAIMYRLNNGVNEKLSTSDLSAVNKLCGIK